MSKIGIELQLMEGLIQIFNYGSTYESAANDERKKFKRMVEFCNHKKKGPEDPSILRNHINVDPNFEWMRIVTPEEAQISWKSLRENWSRETVYPCARS
jgi:hypothetical protein